MFGVDEACRTTKRYDMAEEWLSIVKRLWTEDEEFDSRGQVLQDRQGLPATEADPEAVSPDDECRRLRARPPLRRQILRHGVHRTGCAELREEQGANGGLPEARAQEYGREVAIWTSANIIQAETEPEARRYDDYIVREKGDWEAGTVRALHLGENAKTFSPEAMNT